MVLPEKAKEEPGVSFLVKSRRVETQGFRSLMRYPDARITDVLTFSREIVVPSAHRPCLSKNETKQNPTYSTFTVR
jgi:hypothetical protein